MSADTSYPGETSQRVAQRIVHTGRTSLLVRTPYGRVLVDPGAGATRRTPGMVLSSLELANIRANQIDIVVLTHGHLGHAGGALDVSGQPVYRRARYVLSGEEWAFWMARPDLRSRRLQNTMESISTQLAHLQAQTTLLNGEDEILPGIRLIPAPGHTPGHLALSITSDGSELLCLADAVFGPSHLTHPEWYGLSDLRPEQSVTSRVRLLDRAQASGALVHAYHFPYPSLGWVRQAQRAWSWEHITDEQARLAPRVNRLAGERD